MIKTREHVLDVFYKQLRELAVDERVELLPERAAETTLDSLRLDSLEVLQLAMSLEETFDIEIEVSDLRKNQTILQIADYVVGLNNRF